MKYIIVIIFFIVFSTFGINIGYLGIFPIWKHLTFNFQHANLFHLIVNSFTIFFLFYSLERLIQPIVIFCIMILSSFVASFFCIYSLPVVGASGMVYAGFGILLYLLLKHKLIFKNKSLGIFFILNISCALIISFFSYRSAAMLHLLSLIFGFLFTFILFDFRNFIKSKNFKFNQNIKNKLTKI